MIDQNKWNSAPAWANWYTEDGHGSAYHEKRPEYLQEYGWAGWASEGRIETFSGRKSHTPVKLKRPK